MGNRIVKRLFSKRDVRILVLGLFESGKSTAIYSLNLGDVVTTFPSIDLSLETVSNKNVHITACDVGGRAKVRPLLRHYFRETNGIVFVIDSNDRERFITAVKEIEKLVGEEELKEAPVVVVANKQDLPGAMKPAEIHDNLRHIISPTSRPWAVFGASTSYKDQCSTGIFDAFDWLSDAIVNMEKKNAVEQWLPALSKDINNNKNSKVR